MKIVIAGGGQVGEKLCEVLTRENHDVVVIDTDLERLDQLGTIYDILCVQGNGAVFSVLKEAEVPQCSLFIAVSPHDEVNILAAMTAKRIGADYCIARVRNPEYMEQVYFMRDELGIDLIINPEMETAREIFNVVRFPEAVTVDRTKTDSIWVVSVRVPGPSVLAGLQIREINWNAKKCLIAAIEREREILIPNGLTRIREGDRLYVIGTVENLKNLNEMIGIKKPPIQSALIVGCSRITNYLIPMLMKILDRIKVIDLQKKALDQLNEKYPKVITVIGDGANLNFLTEERIQDYDAIITLTNSDEENMIISIFAKLNNVNKTITKVNRLNLLGLLREMDDETTVTPHEIIAEEILRTARVLDQRGKTDITGLVRLAGSRIELSEFSIQASDKVIYKPLTELKFKENTLIAMITRGKETIIPSGSTEIQPGDSAIIISTDRSIRSVNGVLQGDAS